MLLYKTIRKKSEVEQVIDKSKFIANVAPVETKEEAEEFIKNIKKKYKDATHNVPAMVIGEKYQIQWCSDDGEPQGTSGPPIVQMLVNEGITNIAVVITRYFGGIKLGTGGLVRAYTSSAKQGLEESEVCQVRINSICKYELEYTYLSKIENISSEYNYEVLDIEYGAKIKITIAFEPEEENNIKNKIKNITKGTAIVLLEKQEKIKCSL